MSYDHHEKAGNEGDVCKHPSLIAALDETVSRTAGTPFRYADLYAGYSMNPLTEGHEWKNGIGSLAGADIFARNKHLALWAAACNLRRKPSPGDIYPGSAWFAKEVCRLRERDLDLSLWDDSSAAFADLQSNFPDSPNVFHSRWGISHTLIEKADFVFVDPPDKSDWIAIRDLASRLDQRQSMLIWLPIGANTAETPPAEDGVSRQCREDALQLGMSATTIRWAKGGRIIGCQLIYRLIPSAVIALREVSEEIVRVARLRSFSSSKWRYQPVHYDP